MNVDCIDPLNRAVAAQVAHLLAHKRTCAPAVRARRCGYGRPTPETRRRAADRHTEEVYTVAFSPDGTRIVSGSADKTLRVWPTYPDPASAMCAELTQNMSHKQWRDWVSADID